MENGRGFRNTSSSNNSTNNINGKPASYNGPPMNGNSFYTTHNLSSDAGVDALARGFNGMSFGLGSGFVNSAKPEAPTGYPYNAGLAGDGSGRGSAEYAMGQPYPANGSFVWAQPHAGSAVAPGNLQTFYNNGARPYMSGNNYTWPTQFLEPGSQGNWIGNRMPSGSTEVPSLITPNRRDSGSSGEHDGPGTPFSYAQYAPTNVSIVGHSPESALTWTPSPSHPGYAAHKAAQVTPPMPHEISMLLKQEPVIPKAVPAPFSPTKPLDRALENPHGQTNVYIRGLQPDTTDEMLVSYSSRFGTINSSKAIIDHTTGLCKGFGFVKYHNYKDAERCIRGFHYMGYESSFARESFYAQLKKLHDEGTTNLYVSNLPKSMNEHELGAIFEPFKVCSSRILRHPDGSGRGVGFARFENRDVCEKVIRQFNNAAVGEEDENGEKNLIQIRYADTPEQKALKHQTTVARQYRTAEYESQTKQRPSMFSARVANRAPFPARAADNEFEGYLTGASGNEPNNREWINEADGSVMTPKLSAQGYAVNVNLPFKAQRTAPNVLDPTSPEKHIVMTKAEYEAKH